MSLVCNTFETTLATRTAGDAPRQYRVLSTQITQHFYSWLSRKVQCLRARVQHCSIYSRSVMLHFMLILTAVLISSIKHLNDYILDVKSRHPALPTSCSDSLCIHDITRIEYIQHVLCIRQCCEMSSQPSTAVGESSFRLFTYVWQFFIKFLVYALKTANIIGVI